MDTHSEAKEDEVVIAASKDLSEGAHGEGGVEAVAGPVVEVNNADDHQVSDLVLDHVGSSNGAAHEDEVDDSRYHLERVAVEIIPQKTRPIPLKMAPRLPIRVRKESLVSFVCPYSL